MLNWQTQNANAQNQALHHLGKKIDKVASQVSQTETKVDTITTRLEQIYSNLQNIISELDIDLRTMINNRIWGPEFNKKKKAEIRKLKAELARIDVDKAQPSLFTKTQSIHIYQHHYSYYISRFTILLNNQLMISSLVCPFHQPKFHS